MSVKAAGFLSSRAVRGMLLAALNAPRLWWNRIVDTVETDQLVGDDYGLIGGPGQMKEVGGDPEVKEPKVYNFFIRNKFFELAARIKNAEFRHANPDKLRQWIASHATVSGRHPGLLLRSLINAAETNTCFDGTAFFNASHPITGSDGAATTQSNLLSPTVVDKTKMTDAEKETVLLSAVAQLFSLTDDQGNPINEDVSEIVMPCTTAMWAQLQPVLRKMFLSGGGSNAVYSETPTPMEVRADGFDFTIIPKLVPGMTADLFDLYAGGQADGGPFIQQVLEDSEPVFLDLDSEYSKVHGHVLAKITRAYNIGYGRYARAVRTKISNA